MNNSNDPEFDAFMDGYLESQGGSSGCSVVGNIGEIIGAMLGLIDNLYETETQVFGSADKSLLGATSSPGVLKWFRLTSLHSLIFRSLLSHSPSENEIVMMAQGILAKRASSVNQFKGDGWPLPGETKPSEVKDEPEVQESKNPKRKPRKDLN